MKAIDFGNSPKLKVVCEDGSKDVELYTAEGVALVNTIALKQAVYFRTMYSNSWAGVNVIQFPNDLIELQHIMSEVRPTTVVECGIAKGGSLIYTASILEMLGLDDYNVIGIDIDIRPDTRANIASSRYSTRIKLFEASSLSEKAVEFVSRELRVNDRTLVILDSSHLAAHVSQEIALYAKFVSVGSYLIVMDGALGLVGDVPGRTNEDFKNNPLVAIDDFLAKNPDFIQTDKFDRMGLTSSPRGALRRVGPCGQ